MLKLTFLAFMKGVEIKLDKIILFLTLRVAIR